MPFYQTRQTDYHQYGVDEQDFVAELVSSEPSVGIQLQHQAKERSEDGYQGDELVPDLPLAGQAEGEHSRIGP